MKEDIKSQWVAALRSGDYKQGIGSLVTGDEFCCLGVLCDISEAGRWDAEGYGSDSEHAGGGADAGTLPLSVVEFAGLNETDPAVNGIPGVGRAWHLSELNDDGMTFPQIADVIEYFL